MRVIQNYVAAVAAAAAATSSYDLAILAFYHSQELLPYKEGLNFFSYKKKQPCIKEIKFSWLATQ